MKASAIIVVVAVLLPYSESLADKAPGSAEGPVLNAQEEVIGLARATFNYKDILRTVFPNYQLVAEEKGELIRIGSKYEIHNPSRSIRGCLIRTEDTGGSSLFFAIGLSPKGGEHWKSVIVWAVVRQSQGVCDLLYRSMIPPSQHESRETGYYAVEDVKTVSLSGRNMVIFEYRFADSVSTPRGWHTITKLVAFTDSYQPEEVWSSETEYSFGGASLPPRKRVVQYTFRDVNGDGHKEICLETTTVENDLLIWNGSMFVRPKMYPPEPLEE